MARDELLIIKGRVLQNRDYFENLLKVISDRYTPNEEERERLFRNFDDLLRTIDEKISESERETEEKPESEPENEDKTADYNFALFAGTALIGFADSLLEARHFRDLVSCDYPGEEMRICRHGMDETGKFVYEIVEGGNQNEID